MRTASRPGGTLFASGITQQGNSLGKQVVQSKLRFPRSSWSGQVWSGHINCNNKNIVYYLQCNMCNGKVTKTGKTSTTLRARINNHISDCETGRTSDIFDLHVHECGKKHNGLIKPYFKVKAFISRTAKCKNMPPHCTL